MGNTGIALGRDGAAPFMNPATIVGIDDRKLAFSVNFLSLQVNRFGDFHQPGEVDSSYGNLDLTGKSVSSTRLSGLPSTLCIFVFFSALTHDTATPQEDPTPWKGGRQKFAVCLATIESEDLLVPALSLQAPTSTGVTAQDLSFTRKWSRVQAGPSYSALVNDQLALGISLHGAYTTTSFIQDAAAISSVTAGGATQSSLGAAGNGNSFDLTLILGGTYTLGPVTFGTSVQVPSLHVFGSYAGTLHQTLSQSDASSGTSARAEGTFRAGPPVRIAAGVGVMLPRLTLEADAFVDLPKRKALSSSAKLTTTTLADDALTTSQASVEYAARTDATVNLELGSEYFMTRRLSLLTGIWTNLSALPALNPLQPPSPGNFVQARTHRVGISLGLGSYADRGELLAGAQLGYGWGEALTPNLYSVPSSWSVIDTRNFSAVFVIAGSTNFRSIKRAVEGVKDAVTGDTPPKAPARPAAH